MKLIPEEALESVMREEVEPYLAGLCRKGVWKDALYYELFLLPSAKGTVVISHGFTEASLKFHEMIYYLLQEGWSCAVLDHRGHGFSARSGGDPNVVHIDAFQRYVEEFHGFFEDVVKPAAPAPFLLFGHSMGGCIAARVLEEYPGEFSRAVLNAPMLGLNSGGMPPWLGVIVCDLMRLARKGKERLYFHSDFQPDPVFEEDCATSRSRFDYYQALRREEKALQTSAASYGWTREAILAGKKAVRDAGKICVPVLLLQAENDTLVTAEAQDAFIRRVQDGRLERIAGAKHEIYRSTNDVLENYWALLLPFLDGALRAQPGASAPH